MHILVFLLFNLTTVLDVLKLLVTIIKAKFKSILYKHKKTKLWLLLWLFCQVTLYQDGLRVAKGVSNNVLNNPMLCACSKIILKSERNWLYQIAFSGLTGKGHTVSSLGKWRLTIILFYPNRQEFYCVAVCLALKWSKSFAI